MNDDEDSKSARARRLISWGALFVEAHTQSFYSFSLEEIEILPRAPSPTDEVEIKITGWLATPCAPDVAFSPLHHSQTVFWALAMTQVPEPGICIQLAVPVFHSYRLGKLEPNTYDFILYACLGAHDTCQSEKTVLARRSFSVIEASPEKMIDRDGDGYINDDEILWAINLWISGAIVPGSAQAIDDATMLRLIDLWIKQAKV